MTPFDPHFILLALAPIFLAFIGWEFLYLRRSGAEATGGAHAEH